MKQAPPEWIRKKLSGTTPESRKSILADVLATLEAMERDKGIDLSAKKQAVNK